MDSFEKALQHIIRVEGGYVNHPNDTPTKYGITIETLSSYLGRQASIGEVQRLSLDTTRAIYKKFFWNTLKLSEFPDKLAVAVFDQAVNQSPYKAAILLQTALGITQDGKVGPQTIARVQMANERDLIFDFCREAVKRYIRITQYDPTKLAFLGGWLNRALGLIEELVL